MTVRHTRSSAVAAGLVLLLSGCTLSGGQSDPTSTSDAVGTTSASAHPGPDDAEAPDGPTPEDLAAEMLARAAAPAAPIGSQNVPSRDARVGAGPPVTTDPDDTAPPGRSPNACICVYRGGDFVLGPEPIVMDTLYGPLPEGVDTVSFVGPDPEI